MAQDSVTERPPSPPHSNDGNGSPGDDTRQVPKAQVQLDPFTPPMPQASLLETDAHQSIYDLYGDPTLYHTGATPMYYTPQQTMVTSVPSHTPPRGIESSIQTRSGRALGTLSSPADTTSTRTSPSPRARRNTKKKPKNKKGDDDDDDMIIDQPLSVLTKDYTIPVRDMALRVHRTVEERIDEVQKNKGKIPRPINSFMMYRSAYTARIKQLCGQNNHQSVSKIAGQGWRLEPKEVRDHYEQLAMIDRDNHAVAHPGYKFAPNKSTKRTRRDVDDSDSDSDPEWEGSVRGSKRSRSSRRLDSRSATSTPFEERSARHQRPVPMPALHLSGYETSNPWGPNSVMVGPSGMVGEYYQTQTAIGPYDQVTDFKFERVDEPFAQYQNTMGLLGMPNAGHHELLTTYPTQGIQGTPVHHTNNILDPRLGQFDANYHHVLYYDGGVEPTHEMPRAISYEHGAPVNMGYQPAEGYHPGMTTLTEEHDVWGDQGHAGSDFDSVLQNLN